jgi:hypothetical protein
MFYDLNHAQSRLRDCVIRYKKEPIYIQSVDSARDGFYILEFIYLPNVDTPNPEVIRKRLNEDFNLEPVPLGNINHQNDCLFSCRSPARMWKVGLNTGNFYTKQLGFSFRKSTITLKGLAPTIRGEYPDVESILEDLKIRPGHIAFSRNFSIIRTDKREFSLVFKCRKVIGKLNSKNKFNIDEDYFYLKEMLQEELNV